MLWNLIKHHRLICFFAFSILFSFFFSFGISSNSFATSYSCDIDYPVFGFQAFSYYCPDLPNTFSSSTPLWLSYDINYFYSNDISFSAGRYIGFSTDSSRYGPIRFPLYGSPGHVSVSGVLELPDGYSALNYVSSDTPGGTPTLVDINFTFSDEAPGGSCPECEVCQVCPAIPDNPYDTKLDNITKAVYTCGAILIMIYFFFCIYQIIIKHGGSR